MTTPTTRTSRSRVARRVTAVVAGCLGAALALTGCTPPAPEADAEVDYELTLPFLQDGAEARQYPFGDLVRHGARLAAGSDWPVSSADPMDAIHIAVTRVAPGIDAEPLGGAHQRLDLATVMAAYTSGTAYVNHRDHDTGLIREGYLANLVVLDPDPFSVPADEIHRSTVVSTWVEGESVHLRND